MTSAYIQALAHTASELFEGGKKDLRLRDITRAYFKTLDGPLPPKSALLPANQVTSLQNALKEEGHQVCPVAEYYYSPKCRRRIPDDTPDIRRCLPIGNGGKIVGFRLITGEPDEARLWTEWQRLKEDRSMSQLESIGMQLTNAHEKGLINSDSADSVVSLSRTRVPVALPEFSGELESAEVLAELAA